MLQLQELVLQPLVSICYHIPCCCIQKESQRRKEIEYNCMGYSDHYKESTGNGTLEDGIDKNLFICPN